MYFRVILSFFLLCQVSFAEVLKKTPLSVAKVEFIKGKTNSKIIETVSKNFHGKKVTTVSEEVINGKIKKKELGIFLDHLKKEINNQLSKSKLSDKIKGRIKIQIQKKGRVDILSVELKDSKYFDQIENFFIYDLNLPEIPENTAQKEIQVYIYFR